MAMPTVQCRVVETAVRDVIKAAVVWSSPELYDHTSVWPSAIFAAGAGYRQVPAPCSLLIVIVDGDIHHMSFAIEQGAEFEGRSRRAKSEADLVTILEERVTPTQSNE
jgi:hypothetical protein